jgi:hypothetical protein
MIKSLKSINPDFKEKDIEEILDNLIEEQGQNPEMILDNNYTGESRDTTLLSVLDWTFDRKPIICGNATFYKNQHEAINPVAKMLENFLAKRKMYKKLMTYSTNIDESIIDNFKFVFQPPKITSGNAKADAIQTFQTYSDFIKGIMYDKEDNLNEKQLLEVREFIQLLAEDQLPMLNFEVIRELMADAKAKAVEDKLTPSPEVGDDDLDEDLNNLPDEG